MRRIRLLLAAIAVLTIVSMAPAAAQTEPMDREGPAVVIEEGPPAPSEEAWTFRFLIPTLVGATGLAVAAVVVGYGVRVRGRYRVVE